MTDKPEDTKTVVNVNRKASFDTLDFWVTFIVVGVLFFPEKLAEGLGTFVKVFRLTSGL